VIAPRTSGSRSATGQFTASFDAALAGVGIEAVTIPPRSPRANAPAERSVLTARVTDPMLIFGQRHLRPVLAQYEAHCNRRRPHRGRHFRPPRPGHLVADLCQQRIKRRPVPAASSTSTSGPHKSPDQDRWPSSGTPQVCSHFDEINERLATQGLRTLSLDNPDHVERYGLAQLAAERATRDG
jgi:hypothetical protein